LTHCAFPALYEGKVHREAGREFVDGIREQSIKWQLLLGDRKTFSNASRQTLKLEVVTLTVWSSVRPWKNE
jgi:hypothetical protein